MSRSWMDDLLDHTGLPCPGCLTTTLPTSLCEHDQHPTGPLCPRCCEAEHPRPCWSCDGGVIYRSLATGLPVRTTPVDIVGTPCPDCGGTGQQVIDPDTHIRRPYYAGGA